MTRIHLSPPCSVWASLLGGGAARTGAGLGAATGAGVGTANGGLAEESAEGAVAVDGAHAIVAPPISSTATRSRFRTCKKLVITSRQTTEMPGVNSYALTGR